MGRLRGIPGSLAPCLPPEEQHDLGPPAKKPRIEQPGIPSTPAMPFVETQATGAKPDASGDTVANKPGFNVLELLAAPEETFEWDSNKVTEEEHEIYMKEATLAKEHYTKLLDIAKDRLGGIVSQMDDLNEINKTITLDCVKKIISPITCRLANQVKAIAVDMLEPPGEEGFGAKRGSIADKGTQTDLE